MLCGASRGRERAPSRAITARWMRQHAVLLHGIAFAKSTSSIIGTTSLHPSGYTHHQYRHHVIINPHRRSLSSSKSPRRKGRDVMIGMGPSSDLPPSSSSSPPTTDDDDNRLRISGSSSINSRILPPHILTKIEKFASARGGDALFGYVERCHANRPSSSTRDDENDGDGDGDGAPLASSTTENGKFGGEASRHCFGDVLDAGTGSHSLRWMASVIHRDRLLESIRAGKEGMGGTSSSSPSDSASAVPVVAVPRVSMRSYTAITADETMRKRVSDEANELDVLDEGEVIIGNWNDETLLEGRYYDTILADYLIGAIDGFSPYFQDMAISRLGRHLSPGGRMYIIGLQPIPDGVNGDADVFCKITKVRDACILLAGHRCYREYPLDWIERHVRGAGLDVIETRTYPIRYDHNAMVRQINVGRSKLKFFSSKGMAREMGYVLDGLEKESLAVTSKKEGGRITLGFDYVVVAEKPNAKDEKSGE